MKEFLSRHRIEFTERNIASDATALAELERLGYLTTPVTLIGEDVVVGFDAVRLQSLLGIHSAD